MSTLQYILKKFNITFDENTQMPIEIPNVGRNNLPEWLHELNFKIGVEIGVAAGKYGAVLASANPQMKFYGVDPWQPYEEGIDYLSQETFEKLFAQFQEVIAPYSNYEAIKELSMDAAKKFDDGSLDFVYIDADHSEPYITEDITEWYKKLKVGGILSGHDYIRPGNRGRKNFTCDVIDAIHRFTKDNNIRPWFLIGLNAKIPGMIRDSSRSWMWVKT